jgi:uncharacterized protein YpmB
MRVNVPRIGVPTSGRVSQPTKKTGSFIIKLLVVVILVALAYWLVHNHNENNRKKQAAQPQTINQLESTLSKQTQPQVANGDYTTYQTTQGLIANKYISEKDLPDAERVMKDVLAKVPKDKIISQTYFTMVSLETAKKDNAAVKQYLQLLIAKLRSDGDSQGADAEQKYLDSLK